MWVQPRNIGTVFAVGVIILAEAFVMKMKKEFVPYRFLISHTVIVVEETFQRSLKKFDLTLDLLGASSFQYQLANLLAHSSLFLIVYLVIYLFLDLTNDSLLQLQIDRLPLLLVLFLGILASISFSQFLALFFRDPNLSLGVFLLTVSYFTFFLFNYSFIPGYLFPNLLFCFAITCQFHGDT